MGSEYEHLLELADLLVGELLLAMPRDAVTGRAQDLLAALHGRPEPPGPVAAPVPLTPREVAVLRHLARGRTAEAIARQLAITPHTVSKHQQNIYRKLGTNDRLTTVLRAQQMDLLGPPA